MSSTDVGGGVKPETVMFDAPSADSTAIVDAAERLIRQCLATMRRHLHMEVACVGRIEGTRRWFEYVDASPTFHPLNEGDVQELDQTYCGRMLTGRLPCLVSDSSNFPAATQIELTKTLPVGANISIPLHQRDGQLIGTVCCFSRRPNPALGPAELEMAEVFARMIALELELLRDQLRAGELTRRRIQSVLESGGPRIALQPIVELATGEVYAFEALARFPASEFDDWSTETWFKNAEIVGLHHELEVAALQASLRLMRDLPRSAALSVNLSPDAIVHDDVIAILTRPMPRQLIVELTEHASLHPSADLWTALSQLRLAGVRIAVDDAGAGYAGLHRIISIRPDVLKLDQALVSQISGDPARRSMIEAMVWFGQRSETLLVAEGVEECRDAETLREIGVTHAQGYFFGVPTVTIAVEDSMSA